MSENEKVGAHGIKNAGARYKERIEGLSTESHIYRGRDQKEKGSGTKRKTVTSTPRLSPKQETFARELDAKLRLFFEKEGVEYEEENAKEILIEKPVIPPFPYGMVFLAVVKDVIDVIFVGTVVLSLLGFVFSIPIFIILAFYYHNKLSGAGWKKGLLKKIWARVGLAALVESIPIVGGIIPATTILVLMAHFHETKFVRGINQALETLHGNPDFADALGIDV